MVDINTSASALQAQLQAGLQSSRPGVRTAVNTNSNLVAPNPQGVVNKRIDARQDIARDVTTTDQRAPARQSGTSRQLSTTADIEDASRRAAQFTGPSREAPIGRASNGTEGRNQPLGQVINILVQTPGTPRFFAGRLADHTPHYGL